MTGNTHWSDVLGNYVTARELVQLYNAKETRLTMAQWMAQQSVELWGNEHDPNTDWPELERQVWRDYHNEAVAT